jgi:rhodanese-related sulfurtransferase
MEKPMSLPPEISVTELKAMMDAKADVTVIDVREPHEYEISNIGARLVPLGSFGGIVGELDPDQHYVIHCRSGKRSAEACGLLRAMGFARVQNLAGGILAWADQIDPTLKKY